MLKKLNLTGCWLKDDGIAQLLPLVISELKQIDCLIVSANRMTEACQQTFIDFLTSFPDDRKLILELRL